MRDWKQEYEELNIKFLQTEAKLKERDEYAIPFVEFTKTVATYTGEAPNEFIFREIVRDLGRYARELLERHPAPSGIQRSVACGGGAACLDPRWCARVGPCENRAEMERRMDYFRTAQTPPDRESAE